MTEDTSCRNLDSTSLDLTRETPPLTNRRESERRPLNSPHYVLSKNVTDSQPSVHLNIEPQRIQCYLLIGIQMPPREGVIVTKVIDTFVVPFILCLYSSSLRTKHLLKVPKQQKKEVEKNGKKCRLRSSCCRCRLFSTTRDDTLCVALFILVLVFLLVTESPCLCVCVF